MSEQASPLERDHSLCVVLPGGLEKNITVHGSKPLMDLLVTLCASSHLNPADYTVEILSPNKNNISFKPNSPIGLLEAEKIVLKPKGMEEKIKTPYMPEATVRLLINYNKSHKTVVRVNPKLPLEMLLPVVCDKCEFKVETTILLRDSQSKEPLDLTKTLNDHGLREVFAKDTAEKDLTDHQHQPRTAEAEVISPPPPQDLPKKEKKWKENKGFFSLFRRRKKKHETEGAVSAPASPVLGKQAVVRVNSESGSSVNTLPADKPKKRRAPQPPMGVSQSVPNNLSTSNFGGIQRSAGSTLRSTKRRAPPPPCANTLQELPADPNVKETVNSLNTVDELKESDESESVNGSLCPSPHLSQPQSCSSSSRPSLAHLHEVADPYLPLFRGKDFSDARAALAKVLMSSVSKGTLVKRLRNSATFPKFQNSSSCRPMTLRCPDNEVFSTELESVLNSNLPTESEWEDPAQKRGLTTFKVIPPKNSKSLEPELIPDVQDQCPILSEDNPESKACPEVETNRTDADENPRFPDGSESEAPAPSLEAPSKQIEVSDNSASSPILHDLVDQNCPSTPPPEAEDTAEEQRGEEDSEVTCEMMPAAPSVCNDGEPTTQDHINSEDQKEFIHSPSAEMDQCSSYSDEKKPDEEVVHEEEEDEEEEEKESSFPTPPPPVFFNEDIEGMELEREDATHFSLPSSQTPSPTLNGRANVLPDESTSPTPEQSLAKKSPAPSRFAQAVAVAVQRSRRGKTSGPQLSSGPHSSLPSPPRSPYQYGA